MFVFVIWFIPYSHKSSDFGVNPRFSVFKFGFFVRDELDNGSFQFRCYIIPKFIHRG